MGRGEGEEVQLGGQGGGEWGEDGMEAGGELVRGCTGEDKDGREDGDAGA
jgi:hypothetical protein